MLTGWQTDGTNRYYLDVSTGKMAQGWTLINNAYYYFNESGHMATGWIQINGQYFYLDPSNGTMYANTSITLNGVTYTFGANGVCQNVGNQNTAPGSGSGNISTGGPGSSNSSGGNVSTGGPGSSGGSDVSYNPPGSSGSSSSAPGSSSPTNPGSSSSGSNQNYNSDELVPFLTTGPKKGN